jgi:hypothetical protein
VIVGDLIERYRRGKSGLWYWRQVITTIVISFFTTLRQHKLFALRALVVGNLWKWTSVIAMSTVFRWWIGPRYAFEVPDRLILALVLTAGLTVANAWVVARMHRPYHRAMVLLFLLNEGLGVLMMAPGSRIRLSWIAVFSGLLNVALWNTGAMNVLSSICDLCTRNGAVYSRVVMGTSVVVVMSCLLLGGGFLTPVRSKLTENGNRISTS